MGESKFFLNLPFGEEMAAQHSHTTDFSSRYKFNGKELDKETGYYYYGARYYEPSVSQWLGVDPLVEKYPAFSPYNYTLDNPVMLVDPDGRGLEDEWIQFSTGETVKVGDKGGDKVDHITRVNEDGSITQIEQAAGKMKETASLVTERIRYKYRNDKDFDVAVNEKILTVPSNIGDFTLSSNQKIIDKPHSKGTINLDSDEILSSISVNMKGAQSLTLGNGTMKLNTLNTTVGFDAKTNQIIMGISTPRYNGHKFSLEVKMNPQQANNAAQFAVSIATLIITKGATSSELAPVLQ